MEHTLLAAGIVLALINLIAVIILGLKLRDAREWAATLTRMINTARDEATTAKLERNKLILEQNADALQKAQQVTAEPVEISVSPRQTFEEDPLSIARLTAQTLKPRPEPSRARPGAPTSPALIVMDTGTTYFNAATNDYSPSTSSSTDPSPSTSSSTDSGSCSGGGE